MGSYFYGRHTGRVIHSVREPTFCLFAFCFLRMKNPITLLLLLCCLATACHRPYALYQRTPPVTYHKSPIPLITPTAADTTDLLALVPDSFETPLPAPVLYASARSVIPTAPNHSTIVRVLTQNRVANQTQPKPKPKAQAEPQRKTLREVLGLKPRPKLNWWQRISWRLKASVVVILVAVLFAILHITILAIIFGVIGAFLLIKGLKKSFKVRRPLF